MVSKKVISDIISQYALGGNVEKVKWTVSDDNLYISFTNDSRTVAGEIKYTQNIGLKNGDYGIYDTSKLIKCLNILDGEILLETKTTNGINSKLNIADTSYEIKFNLADTSVIDPVDVTKIVVPEKYNATFDVSDEFITRFVKSKDTLNELPTFTAETREGFTSDEILFTVGTHITNTIEFAVDATVETPFTPIPFSSDLFKEILKSNRTYEKGTIKFYDMLITIEFEFENGLTSKYFLIRLQENN